MTTYSYFHMTISKDRARARLTEAGLEPRGITAAEAAAYLGLSPSTFRRRVKAGKLPPPITGLHRWDLKTLDRHIDGDESQCDVDPIMECIRGGKDGA